MMTWKDLPDLTKNKVREKKSASLSVNVCLTEANVCVCLQLCGVQMDWCAYFSAVLVKKSTVQEYQKCLQRHRNETFISTQCFLKLGSYT